MQRAADLARAGYTHHVGGVIELDKLQRLADRFVERYRIDRDKSNVYKATQRGEAVARLLSWCDEKSARAHWVLMLRPEKALTDAGTVKRRGNAVVLDQAEKWRDLTTAGGRLTLTGYELVRETKPAPKRAAPPAQETPASPLTKKEAKAAAEKAARAAQAKAVKKKQDDFVWTWRYEKTRLENLRSMIINAIRAGRHADIAVLIRDTWATPGFSGARKQVIAIASLIRAEWTRSGRSLDTLKLPEHLGYLRRIPDAGCTLSTLRRRLVLAENRRLKKAAAEEQPQLDLNVG